MRSLLRVHHACLLYNILRQRVHRATLVNMHHRHAPPRKGHILPRPLWENMQKREYLERLLRDYSKLFMVLIMTLTIHLASGHHTAVPKSWMTSEQAAQQCPNHGDVVCRDSSVGSASAHQSTLDAGKCTPRFAALHRGVHTGLLTEANLTSGPLQQCLVP